MNRKKRIFTNIVIIIFTLLISIFLYVQKHGLYSTPENALSRSEESNHFGPGRVLFQIDYDKYISYYSVYNNTGRFQYIERVGPFYRIGNASSFNLEEINDSEKDIYTYFTGGADRRGNSRIQIWAMINNPDIKAVKIEFTNGEVIETSEIKEDNIFIGKSKKMENDEDYYEVKRVIGYGENGKEIYIDPQGASGLFN